MNNQVLLWSMFIIPWLTLFLMNKDDIRRFMSVAMFSTVTTILMLETGISTGMWAFRETTFPLAVLPTYTYSLFPISTLWLFRFTYGRFGKYLTVDILFNFFFAVLFIPWIANRGITVISPNAKLLLPFVTTAHGIMLYGYQMWHEDSLGTTVKNLFSKKLQPAATKPLFKDDDDRK